MSGPQFVMGKMKVASSDGTVHAVWKADPAKSLGRAVMTACGMELFIADGAQQPREEVGCLICTARGA